MAQRKTTSKKSSAARSTKSKSSASKPKSAAKSTSRAKASPKPRSTSGRRSASSSKSSAGSREVTIDRRRNSGRRKEDKEGLSAKSTAPQPQLERRKKVNRRRQIDPTTCERDYTDDEIQFMNAIDEYKRASGRMFPTCSEVLEVVRSLGYVKLSPTELADRQADPAADTVDESATEADTAQLELLTVE